MNWRPIAEAPKDDAYDALIIAWSKESGRDMARWSGEWVHANEGHPLHPQPTHFITCPEPPQ